MGSSQDKQNGRKSEPYSGILGSFGFGGVPILAPCAASMAASGFRMDRLMLKLCSAAMKTVMQAASCRKWRTSAVVVALQTQAEAQISLQMLKVMISRTQQDSAVLTTQVAPVLQLAAKYGTFWQWCLAEVGQ